MKKLLIVLLLTGLLSGIALGGEIDYPAPVPPPDSLIVRILRLITG